MTPKRKADGQPPKQSPGKRPSRSATVTEEAKLDQALAGSFGAGQAVDTSTAAAPKITKSKGKESTQAADNAASPSKASKKSKGKTQSRTSTTADGSEPPNFRNLADLQAYWDAQPNRGLGDIAHLIEDDDDVEWAAPPEKPASALRRENGGIGIGSGNGERDTRSSSGRFEAGNGEKNDDADGE